jgi:hypothetical protein
MSLFNRNKEGMTSLNLEQKEEGQGESFDSAKAEQMELFAENKSVEEIGKERVTKAVDTGKRVFAKVGGFFKSAWDKSKLEKVASYVAAPDALAEEIKKKLDGQLERFSEVSSNLQGAVGERLENAGAGVDSFIDSTKDSMLTKYGEKIGVKGRVNIPKIKSSEAKKSILGLEGDERSMGGELIVGGTIFDRVKEFAGQMKLIRSQYELQQQAAAERRQAGEE